MPGKVWSLLDFGFQYAFIRNNPSKKLWQYIGPCLAQIRRGGPAYVLKRQEILKRTLFSFRSKQTQNCCSMDTKNKWKTKQLIPSQYVKQ